MENGKTETPSKDPPRWWILHWREADESGSGVFSFILSDHEKDLLQTAESAFGFNVVV